MALMEGGQVCPPAPRLFSIKPGVLHRLWPDIYLLLSLSALIIFSSHQLFIFTLNMFSRIVVAASAIFAIGALAMPSPRDLPAGCDRPYTVHLGDTCDLISARYNVSTYQLATVNNGTIDAACDNLALGMPLCLGIAGQDCSTTHVMVSGETCYEIATNAGTTVDVLLANNPNVNSGCTNIYPGEVLCTAKYEVYTS